MGGDSCRYPWIPTVPLAVVTVHQLPRKRFPPFLHHDTKSFKNLVQRGGGSCQNFWHSVAILQKPIITFYNFSTFGLSPPTAQQKKIMWTLRNVPNIPSSPWIKKMVEMDSHWSDFSKRSKYSLKRGAQRVRDGQRGYTTHARRSDAQGQRAVLPGCGGSSPCPPECSKFFFWTIFRPMRHIRHSHLSGVWELSVASTSYFLKQAFHAITLKGGTQEGELDDLDFTLEAVPVQGGVDPGPGSSECRSPVHLYVPQVSFARNHVFQSSS